MSINELTPRQMTSGMTLVGAVGGRSQVESIEDSSAMPGLVVVTTEHGPLYLDPDHTYPVEKEN